MSLEMLQETKQGLRSRTRNFKLSILAYLSYVMVLITHKKKYNLKPHLVLSIERLETQFLDWHKFETGHSTSNVIRNELTHQTAQC